MATTDSTEKIHMGRNVKRFREMLGIKQDALALDLNVSQQTVSQIEQKETIDEGLLQQISEILNVPVEALKTFDKEIATNFFNTFHDKSAFNYQCNFNPLDKYVEQVEENKKLYERLLASERDKVEMLEKIIDGKK